MNYIVVSMGRQELEWSDGTNAQMFAYRIPRKRHGLFLRVEEKLAEE
jgi:hypothetical protein